MQRRLPKKLVFQFLFLIILIEGQFSYADGLTFRNRDSTGATDNSVIQNDTEQLQIFWKEEIPGKGHSTPILHNGNVYVSTALEIENSPISWTMIRNWITIVLIFCLILTSWWKFSNDNPSVTTKSFYGVSLCLLMILVLWGEFLLKSQTDIIRRYLTAGILISLLCLLVSPIHSNYFWKTCLAGIGLSTMLILFKVNLISFVIEKKTALSHLPLLALLLPVLSPYMIRLKKKESQGSSRNIFYLIWISLFFAILPVSYAIYRGQSSHFWKIQPVHSLVIPHWYFYTFGGLLALCGFLWTLQWKWKRLTALACLWTSPCILISLGMLGTWITNSSLYLQYHVARGEWRSIIGNTTGIIIMGILFLCLSVISLLKTRKPARIPKQYIFAIFAMMVLCSTTICLSINQIHWAIQSAGAICCFDADSGQLKWETHGISIPNSRINNYFNSDATPTPIICNKIVVGYFGQYGIFGCNSKTGLLLWSKPSMHYDSLYGAASSLATSEEQSLFFLQNDSSDMQSISAFSAATGAPRWKKEHKAEASWRSPIVWKDGNQEILCVWSGKDDVCLYQASNGKKLLHVTDIDLGMGDPVTSPVYCDGKLHLVGSDRAVSIATQKLLNGNRYSLKSRIQDCPAKEEETKILSPVIDIALDGKGPVCSTPAICTPYMVMISDMGEIHCFNTETGAQLWKETLQETYSSPLIAGNYVYTVDNLGILSVIKFSEQYVKIQQLDLNEQVYSSLVTSYEKLYVRTENHLYCLGVKK